MLTLSDPDHVAVRAMGDLTCGNLVVHCGDSVNVIDQ
jgi:hypothetical protein